MSEPTARDLLVQQAQADGWRIECFEPDVPGEKAICYMYEPCGAANPKRHSFDSVEAAWDYYVSVTFVDRENARLTAALTAATARAEAAEAKLATIAELAALRWDINVAGNHDPDHLLKRIEVIARGEVKP